MRPILLEDDFDGNELLRRPGLYTAISGTPAYPSLSAMAIGGWGALVAEHYDLDGNRVITVEIASAGREVRRNKGQMGIDPEFLQAPLRAYTNWKEAWWREAIQNAMDAGADRIELEAIEQPDGTYLISCTDNGRGMSLEVLMEKFMYLGGTTKKAQSNPAGGFGIAKQLLLLPWMYWDIETQDTQIHGTGVSWDDDTYPKKIPMRRGTRVAVQMPADNHTHESLALNYVAKCHLPGTHITVNGQRAYAKLRGSKVIREIDGHRVYHVPGSTQHASMLIRIVGEKFDGALHTYSRPLPPGVKGMVLVDLVGSSVDLLTENRDQIRPWQLSDKLDEFASELSVDVKSALKAKASLIRKKYRGEGKFMAEIQPQESAARTQKITARTQEIAARMVDAAGNAPTTGGELTSEKVENVLAVLANALQRAQAKMGAEEFGGIGLETAGLILASPLKGPEHLENTLKQLAWNPDFYLANDIEGFKIPPKFTPEKMTPTVIKLLKTWTEFCRFVLAQLNCGTPFGVGFVFSEEWGAMHMHEDEDDEHWLMLNPVFRKNVGDDEQLNPENPEHLNVMYELAIHEATHMADDVPKHNEAFSSCLTYNNAICAPGWRKIRKIASSIKLARVKPEAEREPEPEKKVPASFSTGGEFRDEVWDGRRLAALFLHVFKPGVYPPLEAGERQGLALIQAGQDWLHESDRARIMAFTLDLVPDRVAVNIVPDMQLKEIHAIHGQIQTSYDLGFSHGPRMFFNYWTNMEKVWEAPE